MHKTIKARLTGVAPLLMHNGRLADDLDEYVIQIKAITKKKVGKTADDKRLLDRLEWEGSMYWTPELGPCIPGVMIEAALIEAAKKTRQKKLAQAAIFCDETPSRLEYPGPRDLDGLWAAKASTMLRVGARVQQARVMRSRPIFRQWSTDVAVHYFPEAIDHSDVISMLNHAANFVGIGDWRPKFGRFEVKIL